ncbi:MAG: AAA family ATPase, partial [Desulfobacterales bacterium]|nr:AAA family ATPase [Desulfobacterales bacterium]
REDLYFRLNIFEIEIPPLRERQEEIIPFVHFFLDKFNNKYKVSHTISQNVLDILSEYSWPGNVRELENTIERIVVVTPETIIEDHHLPKHFLEDTESGDSITMINKQI